MKKNSHLPGICVLLFLLMAAVAAAQQPSQTIAPQDAPVPRKVPLPATAVIQPSPGDIEKVSITNRSYRQIYEPYLAPQGPVFITGDAVLQAFHVLLAHSLNRYEQAAAPHLRNALRLMQQQVATEEPERANQADTRASGSRTGPTAASEPEDPDYQGLRQRARLRAGIVVSVALQLVGDTDAVLDPDIAAIVETEVRRVAQARGTYYPDWLGTADEVYGGIDYAVFQPYGSYRQSETLKRYFRAIRWLQSIPFRLDSDEELLSILLLAKSLTSSRRAESDRRRAAENYFRCYRDIFGRKDDQDVLFAAGILKDRPADLETVRQRLLPDSGVAVKSRDRWVPHRHRAALYILSPLRMPDEEFLRRRRHAEGFTYTEPSGLEICALLGSDYARGQLGARLPDAYRQSLQVEIGRFGEEMARDSLYSQYLNTVASLLDSPEPDAPAFTTGPAWEAKSCNAALAGWVHIRKLLPAEKGPPTAAIEETFAEVPKGFVEPDPEFFDRLGDLSERVPGILDRCGALPAPAVVFAAQLRTFERLLAEGRYPIGTDDAGALTSGEQNAVEKSLTILATLENLRVDPSSAAWPAEEIRAAAADVADALVRGGYEQDPGYQALVIESGMDLRQRWQQLRAICRRLEIMAHKQLREVAFNEKETYFLTDFGTALAAVMLYSGDNYRLPRDDAPVAFSFFIDPRSQKYLHAAVARPREIVVPYPFGAQQVICRGAVLPYYEFIAATDFSDGQWRKRLDSDERPSALRWLDPVMLPGDPKKSWRWIETPFAESAP